MSDDIWVLVQHEKDMIKESTFGLIGEARRLMNESRREGRITAVVLDADQRFQPEALSAHGAAKVLLIPKLSSSGYQAELFAKALSALLKKTKPSCMLAVATPKTSDLCPRVAALLEAALVTCVVDLKIDQQGRYVATRPTANGYLFERVRILSDRTTILMFLPSVLSPAEPDKVEAEILWYAGKDFRDNTEIRLKTVMEADPENLDIEEADLIVAGGRGVGKNGAFDLIHELAREIGAAVAGTRPVVDWGILPYDRQIGQTGKTVAPRLMINCGISGANEYTAGMEKSHVVLAINKDPRARIFRFADLGLVGDVHEILPLLIKRIRERKGLSD